MHTPDHSPLTFDGHDRLWLRTAKPWHRFAHIVRVLPQGIERGVRALELHPGDRVLDYGCADQPYRALLPPGVEYVGADIEGNPVADVAIAPDGRVPVEDDSFDAVLSTQVLEHVTEPAVYLAECLRVLRPGGRLVLSTHGTMIWHPDPVDLWRWTCEGLRWQVEQAGLEVVRLDGVVGLAATGVQLFQDGTLGRVPRRLRSAYTFALQSAMRLCDRIDDDEHRSWNSLVYVVVAERPS